MLSAVVVRSCAQTTQIATALINRHQLPVNTVVLMIEHSVWYGIMALSYGVT